MNQPYDPKSGLSEKEWQAYQKKLEFARKHPGHPFSQEEVDEAMNDLADFYNNRKPKENNDDQSK